MFRPHPVTWNSGSVRNFWDFYSSHKDSEDSYFSKHGGGYVIDHIKKRISLNGTEVLDYGSGPGYMLDHFEKRNIRIGYSALDFSAETIRALQDTRRDHPLFREAYVNDEIERAADSRFDVVLGCEVIEHLASDELGSMMNLCRRKLRPGGYLILTTPNDENLAAAACICPECGCIFHRWQHVRSWTRETLRRFLVEQGFCNVEVLRTWFAGRLARTCYRVRGIMTRNYQDSSLLAIARTPL
jgi:2-polyprenyl-3-methyl-5-hydroxy-6-metoxy-1,4-benzoquinol methylase